MWLWRMCLFLQKKKNVVMKNVFIFTEENVVMKNVFIFTEGKCSYEECVYFYRRKIWL